MEGTCFDEDWAAVVASEAALRRVIARLHQAGSERLGPIDGSARPRCGGWRRRRRSGRWTEGLSRGDVRASDAASPVGWVRQWAPSYAAGGAAALVRVTEAIAKPCNGLLAEAVLAARVPVSQRRRRASPRWTSSGRG